MPRLASPSTTRLCVARANPRTRPGKAALPRDRPSDNPNRRTVFRERSALGFRPAFANGNPKARVAGGGVRVRGLVTRWWTAGNVDARSLHLAGPGLLEEG